jgi:hypothetical protein
LPEADLKSAGRGATPGPNVYAEQDVLGSILSSGSYSVDAGHAICDRALALGLLPEHFFLASHADR